MGATTDKYITKSIFDKLENGTEIEHCVAKLHVDFPSHKAMFYLDLILPHAADTGEEGVLGLILLTGDNFLHHKSDKIGSFRHTDENGLVYAVLNDGGLNTRGHVSLPVVNITQAGSVGILGQLFKSAQYVTTTKFGISIKLSTDPENGWQDFDLGSVISMGQSVTGNFLVDFGWSVKGDIVNIKCYILNAEGRYESNVVNFTATAIPVNMTYSNSSSGSACSLGSPTTYYKKQQYLGVGDTIWTNAACTLAAPAGWYSANGAWYKQESSGGGKDAGVTPLNVTEMGACGTGGGGSGRVYKYYSFKSTTGESTCKLLERNLSGSVAPKQIYIEGGLAYEIDGTLATGYYAMTESTGATSVCDTIEYYINGVYQHSDFICSQCV